jgi:hypothetical protein
MKKEKATPMSRPPHTTKGKYTTKVSKKLSFNHLSGKNPLCVERRA